ncbi:hypothetical protein P6P90_16560 [Ectobacillus antri]|uniref:Tetratricopeptide repeat protein n=1 Tax=Ectobacillus antri TaxID=2486280 RepID=A0ABT6H9V3_9BACI|nr:hypothetical protein [Ectobacillus antri]MDG4658526.1 hypothetical protein [Ectobacillus antri]MDG5755509.1 hypothetical protein [Ectobacillus antri]
MNKFRGKSLEELEDLEQELLDKSDEEEKWTYYSDLISLYKEMYACGRKEKDSSHVYAKNRLVHYLVQYGEYSKTSYQKDEKMAQATLEQVLNYDRENPIAHYRLGFLAYKKKSYGKATHYFNQALEYNATYGGDKDYLLKGQQLYNAYRYLANSALYVAANAHKQTEEIENVDKEYIPDHNLSPLYQILEKNEVYLHQHAFYYITESGIETCSKEVCENIIDSVIQDTLVLYFGDQEILLKYAEKSKVLTKKNGDKLLHLLCGTKKESPAHRLNYRDLIKPRKNNVATEETFERDVRRIKGILSECNVPDCIVETRIFRDNKNEIAYYFDKSVNFIIMHRTDDDVKSLYHQ